MSVVEFALELAGDVSSFTPSVRTEMKSAIAARGGVDPSAVELTVTSGSVIVGVRILTPTVMATSVQLAMASATSNASSATAMLASVTGVSIAVLAVVTPPTTTADVAPPPPPPPNAPFIISAGGGEINISSSSLVIASLAVSAALLCGLVICCTAMVCWWMRRRQVELRRQGVNDWPRNISAGAASADKLPQQQPHNRSRARVIALSPLPLLGGGGGGGGGGGSGGIEMSGRFDRHSFETEGSSRADGTEGGVQPAMAGVISASGSNMIHTRTMAERSRMQDMPDMVSQQKEEVQNAAVMSARGTRVTTGAKGPGAPSKDDASPPPYAPQTASSEGALHAVEVQGASPSIGGAAPVVMPRLGEDSIVLHISPTAIANFYSEFEAELDA